VDNVKILTRLRPGWYVWQSVAEDGLYLSLSGSSLDRVRYTSGHYERATQTIAASQRDGYGKDLERLAAKMCLIGYADLVLPTAFHSIIASGRTKV